jgi:hypothetical protein
VYVRTALAVLRPTLAPDSYTCYILRAVVLRGPPHVSWEFIGVSLPRATVRREVVPGGWFFPLAWRVLTHTAAGFVLDYPRGYVMRPWGSKRGYVCPPLSPPPSRSLQRAHNTRRYGHPLAGGLANRGGALRGSGHQQYNLLRSPGRFWLPHPPPTGALLMYVTACVGEWRT